MKDEEITDPWMAAMRRGDFARAWEMSDAVLTERLRKNEDCSGWPRHMQFVWDGRPLTGKRVLVRCYHGLGDTIQFVRLLALLRPQVKDLTLWAQRPLLGLLRSVTGIDRTLPLHGGAPDCQYEADIELMEVPHALRLRFDQLPGVIPYIHVSPISLTETRNRLRVGIVWESGQWNRDRSIPMVCLSPLLRIAKVHWYSLQYPVKALPVGVDNLACTDIVEMARRMAALDLVISVDTMAAHLAGALGLPTWMLLHEQCDWRWMRGQSNCAWYPTMRLFRQRRAGEWSEVIDTVATALQELLHQPSARPSASRRCATSS